MTEEQLAACSPKKHAQLLRQRRYHQRRKEGTIGEPVAPKRSTPEEKAQGWLDNEWSLWKSAQGITREMVPRPAQFAAENFSPAEHDRMAHKYERLRRINAKAQKVKWDSMNNKVGPPGGQVHSGSKSSKDDQGPSSSTWSDSGAGGDGRAG